MTRSRKHVPAAPLRAARAPGFFGATRLQSVLLATVAFLLYSNTLGHQWALDDTIVITNNAFTQRGVAGLAEIFGKDTFAGYFKSAGSVSMVSGGRYRPLTLAMFAVLHQVFGKQPLVFHLLAVVLFAIACLLLYRTLLLLLRDYRGPDYAVRAAWIATLLFIAHPIHTEVVDNVKSCDETVALLGSLGALYLTLKAFDTGSRGYSVAAAGSMFLGLMGKENAATFLVIVPLALVFFRKAKARKIVGLMALTLVAFGGFVAIRAAVLPQLLSKPPNELLDNPYLRWTGDHWVDIALSEKFATILYTLGEYVQLLVAPVTLTHDYYPRQIPLMRMSDPAVLASLALYTALAVYAGMGFLKGRSDLLRFSALYYLITLSIVSNIVFPVGTNMAERFLFMPSIGFCLAVAALLLGLARPAHRGARRSLTLPVWGCVVIVALFGLRTVTRNPVWFDNDTLAFTDILTSPNSAKLQSFCGSLCLTEGIDAHDAEKSAGLLKRSIAYNDRAIALHPTHKSAWLNRGVAKYHLKDYDGAIADLRRALQIAPGDHNGLADLSLVLCARAKEYDAQGNTEAALSALNESYEANHANEETTWRLGVVHAKRGDHADAIRWLARFTEMRPNDPTAWSSLEWAYGLAGNTAKAAECRARADRLNPAPPGK